MLALDVVSYGPKESSFLFPFLLTMSLMIRTASPMEVAWNPICLMRCITSSTVICFPLKSLKSISSTFCTPCGSSAEGTRTAFVASEGGKFEFEEEPDMVSDRPYKRKANVWPGLSEFFFFPFYFCFLGIRGGGYLMKEKFTFLGLSRITAT